VNPAILETRALCAGYGKKQIVNNVSLSLDEGEILLVLGHNGAGKTTYARTVFGLIGPMGGQVFYNGKDITARKPADNVEDGIAFVPQGHGIFPTLSVRDNLELGGFVVRDKSLLPQRLEQAFGLFPILKERAGQIGGTLSGGQQQMLAIGMALMHAPRLLILDEPSIGLAPNLVERVMSSIKEINERFGTTILMIEQNVPLSLPIAHRAAVKRDHDATLEEPARWRQLGRFRSRRRTGSAQPADARQGAPRGGRGARGADVLPVAAPRLSRRQPAQSAPPSATPLRHGARRQGELQLSPQPRAAGVYRRAQR
jgi:branched-chain amino acid transport system ATP-binding protein